MTQIVEAAGFVLFTQSTPASFLLMQHRDRWDFPKGHADSGEDCLQTALRETEEETGIAAHQITVDADFRQVLEYFVQGKKRGDYQKRVTYFLGFVRQQHPVELTEHIGYRWHPWPVEHSIQEQTIDPVLAAVRGHFARFPDRF